MMNINFCDYFDPHKDFNSFEKFERINSFGDQVAVIAVTILATLATFFILGYGGVAAFRYMVDKYSFTHIDLKSSNFSEGVSGAEDSARKTNDAVTSQKSPFSSPFVSPSSNSPSEPLEPEQPPGHSPEHQEPQPQPWEPEVELPKRPAPQPPAPLAPLAPLAPPVPSAPPEQPAPPAPPAPPVPPTPPAPAENTSSESVGPEETDDLAPPTPPSTPPLPEMNLSQLKTLIEKTKEILDGIAATNQSFVSKTVSAALNLVGLGNGQKTPGQISADFEKVFDDLPLIIHHHEKFKENQEWIAQLAGLKKSWMEAGIAVHLLHTQYKNSQDKDNREILDGILIKSTQKFEGFPPVPVSQVDPAPKTYWESFLGSIWQTRDSKELEWKILKYEAQIDELKKKFTEHFSHALIPQQENQPSQEFTVVVEPPGLQVLRDLWNILNVVKIPDSYQRKHSQGADQNRLHQEHLASVRAAYNEKFLPTLRQGLAQAPNDPHLLQVCELLYTELNLEFEVFRTLDIFDQAGKTVLGEQAETHGKHPFVQRIHSLYNRIYHAPYSMKAPLMDQWYNSAKGHFNTGFDPNIQGNPLHLIYELKIGEKTVKALGMGTPTIERFTGTAQLAPEFVGFCRSYKRKDKKHLFVLNQNSTPKDFYKGDESARCQLILGAQDRPDLKGAVYAIALSKNSHFYFQKGEFRGLNNTEDFKNQLFEQILKKTPNESGCYIPPAIRNAIPEIDAKVMHIIEAIHKYAFTGNEQLTVEERKLFIELFYDYLTLMIIQELNCDSFNISCKDAIDRGAGSNAQLFANQTIVSDLNGEINDEKKKKIEALMMVRALFVRKRQPIEERVDRFAETLEFSLANPERLKQIQRFLFEGKTIVPQPPSS